jgi:2-dehydro-3-deoxyphosphogalactonate aldolase
MSPTEALHRALDQCNLIAILRGLRCEEAAAVGQVLYDAGFRIIEVPLNSPDPLQSIRILRDSLPEDVIVGAGTVLRPESCAEIADAGGQIIVMPHADPAVIRAAKAAGLACAPGVATPTEAFAALAAGADILKMFPAETLGPVGLRAWRAVLTPPIAIVPVGGVDETSFAAYVSAGASGFGLGSTLYRPGASPEQVAERASALMHAWRTATGRAWFPSISK